MYCADYVGYYKGYEIFAIRGGYIAQWVADSKDEQIIDEIDLTALERRIDRRLSDE